MSIFPCLNNVIGLTRTTATVYTENLVSEPLDLWYTKSTSGIFLDELPGIPTIKTLEQSLEDMTELPKWYQEAIESAKVELATDLAVGFSKRFRQANKNYQGQAGGLNFAADNPLSGTYGGIWIRTNGMRGAKLKIRGVYGMFNTPPTVLKLYRIPRETFILEFIKDVAVAFNPNANTLVDLASPEILELDGYDYALVYELDGVVPKNNLASCGCGAKEYDLKRYIQLVGINGSNLNAVNTWSQTINGNGLALLVDVGCYAENVLCELYESADVMAKVIAHCVRYKAGEFVIEKVMNSDRVNRAVMLDREYYWGKRNHYRKEYLDRIDWIVETVDMSTFTDCFTCNTGGNKRIAKSSILT